MQDISPLLKCNRKCALGRLTKGLRGSARARDHREELQRQSRLRRHHWRATLSSLLSGRLNPIRDIGFRHRFAVCGGVDRARQNDIGGDSGIFVFDRDRSNQRYQRGFGGTVGSNTGPGFQPHGCRSQRFARFLRAACQQQRGECGMRCLHSFQTFAGRLRRRSRRRLALPQSHRRGELERRSFRTLSSPLRPSASPLRGCPARREEP